MKEVQWQYRVHGVLIALALAAAACRAGAAPATATPESTEGVATLPPHTQAATTAEAVATQPSGIAAGTLQVRNATSYVDDYDYYHVVGEVFNNSERPLTNIELTIVVRDVQGESVLVEGVADPVDYVIISPLLYTLAPGESTPFDFYMSGYEAEPATWTFQVEVSGHSTGRVSRARLQVENDQVVSDDFGGLYITGELVNLDSQPALVNGLAGALLGADDAVLAAASSYTHARYLAPAGDAEGSDRTPFAISLDGPIDSYTQAAFYWDSDVSEPLTAGSEVSVEVVNSYRDDFDHLHLVALVTNHGSEVLNVSLVAGLYDRDGIVLDSVTLSTPVFVVPGGRVPVNFDFFSILNYSQALRAQVERYSIQIDRYWTYSTTWEVVDLDTRNETNELSAGGIVTFVGDVVNTSDVEVTSATLVLGIYDVNGNLVTSSWMNVFPDAESAMPGDAMPFELSLYLPSDADISEYSFDTQVQGFVK
jgi:hypothetical protein